MRMESSKMAVNRHHNHLVVFLEDKPYRELVNGAKTLLNINERVIDDKDPSGGWNKVFVQLEENLPLLNNRQKMHALLLMDFDNAFEARINRFKQLLANESCAERVFILGIDAKESENLKRTLKQSNNEKISKILLENCPSHVVQEWQNQHLNCNQYEIKRMREQGVFKWLFNHKD